MSLHSYMTKEGLMFYRAQYACIEFSKPPLGQYYYCCLVIQWGLTLGTPWTIAHQAPLPCDFPGKNTGVGCYFLLYGIFLTQ